MRANLKCRLSLHLGLLYMLAVLFCYNPWLLFAQEKAVLIEKDILYGDLDETWLKLDLAKPEVVEGLRPALIFIPGSSWGLVAGYDRTQYEAAIKKAAELGYVAITVDHRPLRVDAEGKIGIAKWPFPAQLYDVKKAVRWLRANSERYNVDPNRFGAIGCSSGAHLALMLGLTNESDGFEGEGNNLEISSAVHAVVNLAGWVDLVAGSQVHGQGSHIVLLGGTLSEVPEQYKRASPIIYIRKGAPPILSVHGENDTRVPLSQSQALDTRMKEVESFHRLIIVPGAGHFDCLNFWKLDTVWDFLDKYVIKNRS